MSSNYIITAGSSMNRVPPPLRVGRSSGTVAVNSDGGSGRGTGGYALQAGRAGRSPPSKHPHTSLGSSSSPAATAVATTASSSSSKGKLGGFSSACYEAHKARKDPTCAPPVLNGAEASRGVMSLIERGLLPPAIHHTSTSSSSLKSSQSRGGVGESQKKKKGSSSSQRQQLPPLTVGDLLGGGLATMPVTLHNPVTQHRRPDVAAASSAGVSNHHQHASGGGGFRGGTAAAFNIKYDLPLIEATVPGKALQDPSALPPPGGSSHQPRKPPPLKKGGSMSSYSSINTTNTTIRRPRLMDDDVVDTAGNTEGSLQQQQQQQAPREDTRTYTELLDLYSLHEFVIRKGSALRSTPEFASYMRSFEHQWGSINQLISMLESLLQTFSVPLAYIDGKKLANLARVDLGAPTREELCSCITNIAEIGHYLVAQSQAFRGTSSSSVSHHASSSSTANSGHQAAATAIQSTYRMHRVKGYYQRLRVATWAVRVIQKQWSCHCTHVSTKKAIAQLRDSMSLRWRETMESFISSWSEIKTQRRTIIHIPSLSTLARLSSAGGGGDITKTMASLGGGGATSIQTAQNTSNNGNSATSSILPSLQAAQLPRLADLSDPNVDVILISPFKIDQDVLQHYTSAISAARDLALALSATSGGGDGNNSSAANNDSANITAASSMMGSGGVNANSRGWTSPASRLTVLVPENARRLPPNLPLTSMVLLSTKMMRCLANLVRGKVAYIVPGEVGHEELQLASKLNIPVLGVEPGIAAALATKGGQRTIFEAADAATPVGAHNLRSVREAFLVVGRLIVEYRETTRWIFKIDSETGSRGHAVLDVQRLTCFTDAISTGAVLKADTVARELAELAPRRIKVIHSEAYPDWIAYMNMFDAVGGSVEAYPPGRVVASPTVNLFIDPYTGVPEVCSIVENIHSPSLTVLGHVYPPPCLCAPSTSTADGSSSSSNSPPLAANHQQQQFTRIPYHVLRDAAIAIGTSAFRRRVIGYCSIDFVAFLKAPTSTTTNVSGQQGDAVTATTAAGGAAPRLRIWAVDIDLRLTDGACMHKYVCLVTGSPPTPDPTTGLSYFISTNTASATTRRVSASVVGLSSSPTSTAPQRRPLRYIYSGLLHHPYIGAVRHSTYFNKCRQRSSIAYSIEDRSGVIFHLVDSLLRGCLGMVGVGPTFSACIDSMADAFQLLQADLPSHVDGNSEGSNLANFTTALKVLASTYNIKRNTNTAAVAATTAALLSV